jgi:SAM-dependent methyltransferase
VAEPTERTRLTDVYAGYADDAHRQRWDDEHPGNTAMVNERDAAIHALLAASPGWTPDRGPVLDVGCGNGDHLARFLDGSPLAGADAVGVDLLADRLSLARAAWGPRFARADGTALPIADDSVGLALAFTVFSSILEPAVQQALADELTRVLAPGGAIAIYDMRVPSNRNRNVRPVSRRRLGELFPLLTLSCRSTTLLPPLARRLGSRTGQLYPALSRVPLLHTHLVAVLTPA